MILARTLRMALGAVERILHKSDSQGQIMFLVWAIFYNFGGVGPRMSGPFLRLVGLSNLVRPASKLTIFST